MGWNVKNSAVLSQILAIAAAIVAASTHAYAAESSYTVIETVEYYEYVVQPDRVAGPVPSKAVIARFGPFRVISPTTVEMIGTVDSYSPEQFRMMIMDYPNITDIHMIDCPGSLDDDANLEVARMIRDSGMNTHVPATGSVRSGAVELFIAGKKRSAEPGAEFAVHSWRDEDGKEAGDYAASDPVHKNYLSYYVDMGIPSDKAKAFYKLTNSVPFEGAYYLTPQDLNSYQLLN